MAGVVVVDGVPAGSDSVPSRVSCTLAMADMVSLASAEGSAVLRACVFGVAGLGDGADESDWTEGANGCADAGT